MVGKPDSVAMHKDFTAFYKPLQRETAVFNSNQVHNDLVLHPILSGLATRFEPRFNDPH